MDNERPSPARPWFDLVTERIAVRGWSVAELARKAHVSRPTIYGWRDNPARPQAKPVNAVADALGIPREHALRLAGVIAAPADAERSPPQLSEATKRLMREELGDELAAALIAHYGHIVSGRIRPAAGDDPPAESGGRGRRPA